ncbi:beta-glucosidase [Plectosphaerella cucumerina]|uniref:Probable beta-glucosidase btgE n=1 Tax=Plectosphaerella cucumerina TaxID=40658 RepID=A0A8K0TA03_9PEZI|nr:beta-glucosidase [Plectosphaerella cucumerina]
MKGSLIIAAAAAAGASAAAHRHAQAHAVFKRYAEADVCVPGCKTIYTTYYGEATLVPNPPSPKTSSAPAPIVTPVTTAEPKPTSTFTPPGDVPTPVPELCPTPGTYTFPATTITVKETTTVCAPETTKLPPGPNTYGGVTTVVEEATTIVCPYPTAKTNSGVVTSVIETTTYVCPTPGTYTIAPTTTDCAEETTVVYPTITTVTPGTYTRPAVTTTIVETNVIVVCPWTSEAPKPTSAPAPAPEPETPTPAPAPVYEEPEAPAPVYEAPTKAAETPKPSDTSKATDVSLGGSPGDHWAITYTPFSQDASGSCKSAEEVDSDIKTIKNSGFTTVRIYSTDCSTLENVGAACKKYGLKLIIGVFVKDSCDPNSQHIKEQVDAITAWKQWDMVELVVVGNEALFQNRCDVSGLKNLISSVKSSCGGAGYTGPYTTAETLGVWEREDVTSALCGVIDIVGGQIHPFFNADVAPSDAGKFVKSQLDILNTVCSGKSSLNLECGWPTGGIPNGKAIPGKSEQAQAIQSIREVAGDKTVFFSFHNDEWKDPGSCGCEQTWGCGQLF